MIQKAILILGKIVLALVLLLILLFIILKISGFMNERKSNELLIDEIKSEQSEVVFSQITTSEQKTLSYAAVTPENQSFKHNTAIVMIHGSPGSLDGYIAYLKDKSLIERANLYSVDRPGFGFSDFGVAEPSLEKQCRAIFEFIKTLKEDRIVLVGHSFGGAVISRLAMDYPETVDGFLSIAGTLSADAEPHNWWRKIVDFGLIRVMLPKSLVICNSEMLPLKDELTKIKDGWASLNMPITILHGSSDGIVSYQNLIQIEQQTNGMSNVDLRPLYGKGHMILWTMTDEMIQEIHLLLDRIP